MNATAIVKELTCQLLDAADGIPADVAAAGLIISHGHFLHRDAFRRTITASTSISTGQPLAVIAGWSDMDRGMPGYSRDVIGQTPFGWSLDEAMEGLAPRLERSRAYWRWRQSASGWDQFQQALHGHLQARVGPGGH